MNPTPGRARPMTPPGATNEAVLRGYADATPADSDTASSPWQRQWAAVPATWHGPWVIDTHPFTELFTANANYAPGRAFDFRPDGPPRLGQELTWWLYTCWREGLRKVEPSMLTWWSTAITTMARTRAEFTGRPPASILDFEPHLVVREAVRAFDARNHRMPSPGNLRNLTSIANHIHQLAAARTTDAPWWAHDRWDLTLDDRIPRRPHEPAAHRAIDLSAISPPWLRDGVRYWLSTALTSDYYRWTTIATRATSIATYFTPWLTTRPDHGPVIEVDPDQLRIAFDDFQSWLRAPAATSTGKILGGNQIAAISSHVQSFYQWMLDHHRQAATATADPRWNDLTDAHARLWTPTYRRARPSAGSEHDWIAAADIARMAAWTEALFTPTDTHVTIRPPGMTPTTVTGLGDPQAARAWLLQAMTGRRVSEILMLDFDPLTALPGLDTETAGPDDFVARLRYQQTKVDGIDATILVDAAVVDLITAQQAWARAHTEPGATPTYLFLAPRHNHKGQRPRPYPSHQAALRRLDDLARLRDSTGAPLKFTRTHRLRHTRATELLNAGVPIHIVQRYLGHRSPEMTMRYAATLARTAEAEFLKPNAPAPSATTSPSPTPTSTRSPSSPAAPTGSCPTAPASYPPPKPATKETPA